MSSTAVRLTIHGKVQGVGFRFYTQRKAQELHISGWVINQRDGTVYVEAEGDKQAVDTFIDWCNEGPSWAEVRLVQTQEIPLQGFDGFVVR
ncbi:MAG: acylphosphatase [Bacteroidetes bacterium CG18_big_fil_WC_8_21_14_2_50_41_14]|nr:MAG: acylphosphatase [Bacteroidetes bacterium CG18_big_fil_WC_8_21_14_2_50_41_14]PIY32485.1 MAG: acylphosphatase [Bacteroidetes bacterium CG_4_10_14_3_um_filter_42_6]PJB55123.1 MAG: acylphosphatase [Bacteroidetes bacterium CG_4_9_14_3_um_filter_41_19]